MGDIQISVSPLYGRQRCSAWSTYDLELDQGNFLSISRIRKTARLMPRDRQDCHTGHVYNVPPCFRQLLLTFTYRRHRIETLTSCFSKWWFSNVQYGYNVTWHYEMGIILSIGFNLKSLHLWRKFSKTDTTLSFSHFLYCALIIHLHV